MSDQPFHAPVPHVHDPATDLGDDEAADSTPPGGLLSPDGPHDVDADERPAPRGDGGEGDDAIPVAEPISPDL